MLCCARTKIIDEIEKKIISLARMDLDWEYLINMASRHRLRPLLYVNLNSICPENVPEDILLQLKASFHETINKNLLFQGELVKILKLIESNDITAIPYKGPVLAKSIYGNIGLRTFADLDIYIHESDVLNVKKLLISNGYELKLNNVNDSKYIKSQREYKFINKNTGVPVEIHWKLQGISFSFPINPNSIFTENIESIELSSNYHILSFSPENLLLILSIHNASHRWPYLNWISDIAELINTYENINWDIIMNNAEELGIKRILCITISLVKVLFEIKIPKRILEHISADNTAQMISNQLLIHFFSDYQEENLLKHSILHFKIRENLRYGLKDLILHIIAPSTDELDALTLSNNLFYLYYIFRPIFLVKKYVFKLNKRN